MSTTFFSWKEEYATGIDVIDFQHKKLVNLINRLYVTFMEQTEGEHLDSILQEVLDYAHYHFDTEASLMRKSNFPGMKEHIAQHDTFESKAIEVRHKFRHGGKVTSTLMNFLRNWLNDHILRADREYIPYIKNQ